MAGNALAQPPHCGPAAKVFKKLADTYSEYVVFKGIDMAGRSTVITMSRTGIWTLLTLVKDPTGKVYACFLKTGSAGEVHPGEAT